MTWRGPTLAIALAILLSETEAFGSQPIRLKLNFCRVQKKCWNHPKSSRSEKSCLQSHHAHKKYRKNTSGITMKSVTIKIQKKIFSRKGAGGAKKRFNLLCDLCVSAGFLILFNDNPMIMSLSTNCSRHHQIYSVANTRRASSPIRVTKFSRSS